MFLGCVPWAGRSPTDDYRRSLGDQAASDPRIGAAWDNAAPTTRTPPCSLAHPRFAGIPPVRSAAIALAQAGDRSSAPAPRQIGEPSIALHEERTNRRAAQRVPGVAAISVEQVALMVGALCSLSVRRLRRGLRRGRRHAARRRVGPRARARVRRRGHRRPPLPDCSSARDRPRACRGRVGGGARRGRRGGDPDRRAVPRCAATTRDPDRGVRDLPAVQVMGIPRAQLPW